MKAYRDPLSTNTPGYFGYLAAYLLSCLVCSWMAVMAVAVVEPLVAYDGGPNAYLPNATVLMALPLMYVPAGAVACAVVGLPIGFIGVVAVHLLCRRVPAQRVHVVVTGVVVAGLAVVCLALLGPSTGMEALVPLSAGAGACAGRAAVIPLVGSRRRLAAVGRLTGTAR